MEMGGGARALEVKALALETQSVKKFPAPLREKKALAEVSAHHRLLLCKEFSKEDGSSEGLLGDFVL